VILFVVFITFCVLVKIYIYPVLKTKIKEEQNGIRNSIKNYEEEKKELEKQLLHENPIFSDEGIDQKIENLEENYRHYISEHVRRREKEHQLELDRIKERFYKEQEKIAAYKIISKTKKELEKINPHDSFSWALNILSDKKIN
jgi:F0F1-type ATP synthase membrane subunit b/b'